MHEEGACMSRLAQLGSFRILCPLWVALSVELLLLARPSLPLNRLFVHGLLIRDSQILVLRRDYVPFPHLFRFTHGSCRGLVLQAPPIILDNCFFSCLEQRLSFLTVNAFRADGDTSRIYSRENRT